jgi:hypothetical protein
MVPHIAKVTFIPIHHMCDFIVVNKVKVVAIVNFIVEKQIVHDNKSLQQHK